MSFQINKQKYNSRQPFTNNKDTIFPWKTRISVKNQQCDRVLNILSKFFSFKETIKFCFLSLYKNNLLAANQQFVSNKAWSDKYSKWSILLIQKGNVHCIFCFIAKIIY